MGSEKTQGEPYTWESVRVGDRVRVVETTQYGDAVIESVVKTVDSGDSSIALVWGRSVFWCWKANNKSIELLHRPPRRREISKDDLILKTPIGTRVVLEFPDELGQKAGVFQSICRSDEGWVVRMGGTPFEMLYVVKLSDIKAIYTEEVQG